MRRRSWDRACSSALAPTGEPTLQIGAAAPRLCRLLAVLALACLSSCNIDVGVPTPGPPLSGSGGQPYAAAIEPYISVLAVNDTVLYEFRLYDRVNGRFLEVLNATWTNEHPEVVRLVSPVESCGTRCAQITGLATGRAQIRAFTIAADGTRVESGLPLLIR
jgi:hypothetical protein